MRATIAAFVLASSLWIGSGAEAQGVVGGSYIGGETIYFGEAYPATYVTYGYSSYPAAAPMGFTPSYSYYAGHYPYPARIYSGYGTNDFPFSGRPYGHPYDAWSWPYLMGSPYGPSLARYYYPPLG